jgi:PAS domain S-box-containing protein
LDITREDRDALRTVAGRVPHLQSKLDESLAESRRQFEQTPHGIGRWNRDGALVRANRPLVRLLGYRTGDELQAVDFASRVFVSGDDLRWLIERCLTTGTKETAESTWRRKDGSRRIVRLLASAVASDLVEIIAEDITDLRAKEEQLRQAQRMEAVGRLASEVAVTCTNLLRDVSDEGHVWMDSVGNDTALRRHGERLVGEVTRAASFLRQLAVYGEQQVSALEPVNLNQVLRGLEPVLNLVAGDGIELILPKASRPINVDVAMERVERILVNVASYARQRMPFGGRLKIDLARVVVDRRFLAKYPNVRPGAHALITITEEHVKRSTDVRAGDRNELIQAPGKRPAPEQPGVDLGALLELIAKCGGHLWMAAEPSGNMVLRIHLPQRVSDGLSDAQTPTTRPAGERAMARLFGR